MSRSLSGRPVHLATGSAPSVVGTRLTFAPNLSKNLDAADAVSDSIKDDIDIKDDTDAYIARENIDAPEEPRYTPLIWPNR